MELKEIKELIALMEEHDLAELEVEREGLRIHIKKSGTTLVEARPILISPPPPAILTPQSGTEISSAPTSKLIEIKSPMVGTFYRAPSLESPAFVEEGQMIEVGQVICIIEAMKLMNEIKSEVKGKLHKVLVENGEPVEFGQPLFVLEPA